MRGLERLVDDVRKIAPDRVQIDRVAQPRDERGHDCLGVVVRPVEPAVDGTLHSLAQRVEQRRDDQRGHRDGQRALDRQHPGGQENQAGEHAAEQDGDQRVGDHPADDAVELVQPVLQYRHRHADGQGCRAEGHQHVDRHLVRPAGGLFEGERDNEHAEDRRGHEDARAAVEPLELLAALTAGVPVGRYLKGQPGHPADQGPDDQYPGEDTHRPGQRVGQIAVGVDTDIASGGDQHTAA